MALSDLEILSGIERNEIVIQPFNSPDLGSASYDVRLGEWYYEARREIPFDTSFRSLYNIYSALSVQRIWEGPTRALSAEVWKTHYTGDDWSNIHDDDKIIMLAPHANLLCHTVEFIGSRTKSTTMMKARSSIGRSLVNVCQCAGMGDIGYFNRWTMEVYNRGDYWIPLVVGRRIAQIVFLPTGESEKVYNTKYQHTTDVTDLIDSWTPDMMLPRLDLDRDINSVLGAR